VKVSQHIDAENCDYVDDDNNKNNNNNNNNPKMTVRIEAYV